MNTTNLRSPQVLLGTILASRYLHFGPKFRPTSDDITAVLILSVTAFLLGCYPFYLLEIGGPEWQKRQYSTADAWAKFLGSFFALLGYAFVFVIWGYRLGYLGYLFAKAIAVGLVVTSPELYVFAMGVWIL